MTWLTWQTSSWTSVWLSVWQSEPLDHHFSSEIHFPDLCLPLTPGLAEDDLEEEEACSNLIDIQNDTVVVSCDHNYTADETNRNWEAEREWTQQKRIRHLEGQVRSLRKKLKTMQQKCRRQDRKLKRMKAAITVAKTFHGPAFSKKAICTVGSWRRATESCLIQGNNIFFFCL